MERTLYKLCSTIKIPLTSLSFIVNKLNAIMYTTGAHMSKDARWNFSDTLQTVVAVFTLVQTFLPPLVYLVPCTFPNLRLPFYRWLKNLS